MAGTIGGTFRQRARISEKSTEKYHANRRKQAAAQTHLALSKFEERLARQEDAQFKLYDDLDEAGARATASRRLNETIKSERGGVGAGAGAVAVAGGAGAAAAAGAHGEPAVAEGLATRSASDSELSRPAYPHSKKPPSPLTFYDYGCVSPKPRSLYAQQRDRMGEPPRREHRSSSCGFYFPGPNFERGPYGFSMLDPVLMPPRSWEQSPMAPDRWRGDPGDVRPMAAQELNVGRNRSEHPAGSPLVRLTAAHAARAKLAFQHLDKRREEAVLEQAIFENGVYDGRWRDPLLDRSGELPEVSPPEEHDWVGMPVEDMKPAQVRALRILYGIDAAVKKSMGRFSDLFAAENVSGPKGVLEVSEFHHGLLRLGVIDPGDLAADDIREMMAHIDPAFDGRVNLPVLARAIAAVRHLKEPPPPRNAGERTMQLWRATNTATIPRKKESYGTAAPIDAIRLNYRAGLFDFGKSFDRFRTQQRVLLSHHEELA